MSIEGLHRIKPRTFADLIEVGEVEAPNDECVLLVTGCRALYHCTLDVALIALTSGPHTYCFLITHRDLRAGAGGLWSFLVEEGYEPAQVADVLVTLDIWNHNDVILPALLAGPHPGAAVFDLLANRVNRGDVPMVDVDELRHDYRTRTRQGER